MSDFLAELKKQHADALERRRIIERELEAIDVLIARAEGRDIPETARGAEKASALVEGPRAKRPPGEAKRKRKEIVEACRRHLRTAPEPIRRVDLLGILKAEGIEMPSADPRTYFSSLLWNHKDEIVNFYEQGYWLAERPYPPLKYKGLKDEVHPLILSRQTGLKAIRDNFFHDGGNPDDSAPDPDDGRPD
jgi:hypothetical protein